jgi:hypothetical protein
MVARKKPKARARHLRAVPPKDEDAGPPWNVVWHPDAVTERSEIEDAKEQVALQHAGDKLVAEGPRLRFPHQSSVKGEAGKKLRELRPRRGRSPWRAFYRQFDKRTLVVLAVGPEAQVDGRAFAAAVARANARFDELEP